MHVFINDLLYVLYMMELTGHVHNNGMENEENNLSYNVGKVSSKCKLCVRVIVTNDKHDKEAANQMLNVYLVPCCPSTLRKSMHLRHRRAI